jgi:hypothetical protein
VTDRVVVFRSSERIGEVLVNRERRVGGSVERGLDRA